MRPGLRTKILLITALTPAVLGATVLLAVHRRVRTHVDSSSIHENLEHSATVFESMLAVRLRALAGSARVIARDPRFFSLVMLRPGQRDARFIATVKGTANDFNRITETDLFEVFDRDNRLLATVGKRKSEPGARGAMVKAALAGREAIGLLVQKDEHFQVAVMPVRADGQIVGALLLGAGIGGSLATELKSQMLSEVTFLSRGRITGTTLESAEQLDALRVTLASLDLSAKTIGKLGVVKVRAGPQTFLTLVRPIPNSLPGSREFYVMQRSHDPESAFLRQMQGDMLLIGILGVLVALLAGSMFSRQITGPVLALVRAARAMEHGDFEAPIKVRNRDEIGYLAERFRGMRERERSYVDSLEEAARVKSEFISVASHELRTPVSVIQGYRDLLADGSLGEVSPHQQQALHAIRDCLAQITKVAEDATQVAQIEGERLDLKLNDTPVAPLVEQAIALARSAANDRKVRVSSKVKASVGSARVDPERMAETLAQLIGNGIRFTPEHGQVEIHGHGDDRFVVLQVRDTGVGIPPDRLEQLFQRSLLMRDGRSQSSNVLDFSSAGRGFGLAISRAIVEAHGGTIDAQSQPDEGTTVTIRLPRVPVEVMRTAA